MMGDMSVNCPACGANPHEECRMPGMGNHKAIDCLVNPVAADSRMDDMTEPETMLEHIEEGHPTMMIRRSFEKAWDVVKYETNHIPGKKKSKFGEKFQRKLDSLKEGARGVPEKFSDLTPTTPYAIYPEEGKAEKDRQIRKPPHSPFKPSQALIDRATSGTHTMPGSSKYRRDED